MGWLLSLLTGGWFRNTLDRVLDTVDKRVQSETDREKLRADIIIEHYRTRADFMKAGGFWLMFIFAAPLAVWWAMVLYDSAFGCADCVWANDWTVAALPAGESYDLNEWAGGIIVAIFGVVGVSRFRR